MEGGEDRSKEVKKQGSREAKTELGGHFEEEVEAEEEEDKVRGPGGQDGRELAYAAHGFEQGGDSPIENTDGNAEGDSTDSAAIADKNGKGYGKHHANRGDEWIR